MASVKETAYRYVLTTGNHCLTGIPVFACAKGSEAVLPLIDHRHRDKYECVLLESGTRTLTAAGVPYTVYPENAFLTHPDEPHSGDHAAKTAGEMLWFQLNAEGPLLNLTEQETHFIRARLYSCKTRLFHIPPHVYEMFRESFTLLQKGGNAALLKGRALFVYALTALLEAPEAAVVLSPEIDRAKQYIHAHIRESIDADDLREASGLKRGEFETQFEKQLGFEPKEYILRMKLDAAAKDLAQTKRSMADIAFGYSFSSVFYFKTVFKRYMGVSADKYRKKQQKTRVR